MVSASPSGNPAYLRDVVDITRAYQSPPRYLNFYTWRDTDGRWHRSRAVTLAVQSRAGGQRAGFGRDDCVELACDRRLLPCHLVVPRATRHARHGSRDNQPLLAPL